EAGNQGSGIRGQTGEGNMPKAVNLAEHLRSKGADEFYAGRKNGPHVNVYVCQKCGGRMVTRDVDPGTTPFLTRCTMTNCTGMAQSCFYRVPQDLPHSH